MEQATEEERAAIRAMLSRRAESAPAGARVSRASAWAWAGLRLAAFVLLAAGVGIGLGDGDEFDDVGCSVALRPARTSHEARSAQNRERGGGKLPVSGGGSAGASGDGGPYGGKAETLKAEMLKPEDRGRRTEDRGGRDYGGKGEAGPFRYSLRRQGWCWVLDFIGGRACLKPEIGLSYVGWLLSAPDEAVPCAKVFSRFSAGHRKGLPIAELPDPETGASREVTDGVGIAQLPASQDEAEARSRYYGQLREYREAIEDPAIPESERAEAQRSYDDLAAFLQEHYQRAPDPGRAVTKLVHRSIRRLCDHLREPMPGERAPNPVAAAFGEYLEKHILVPSRRYTRAKRGAHVRIARGELAGRVIFECPPGDRWSVQL